MKRIQMPSSYAVVPDGEKALLGGGGAFRDAWTSFTDHLRFTDFFFRGGLLSLSISFIPKLLFNVVKAGFNVVEGVDRKSTRLNSSHVSESRMPSSA